ncbi:hypothetical protein EPIR_3104 [Erwinia piriflorinigrans CFBP 5888]|uniref:Uncharacterized protein n=1 Tax=Erwinia piriflorinigrans CFBP 5888 TaxID=1161919 RepID=V5ZBS0_9GAMM|nr:hypothetical protein EPIR_3104 [Erwinia piriflorinigrans CFBP 5888]
MVNTAEAGHYIGAEYASLTAWMKSVQVADIAAAPDIVWPERPA